MGSGAWQHRARSHGILSSRVSGAGLNIYRTTRCYEDNAILVIVLEAMMQSWRNCQIHLLRGSYVSPQAQSHSSAVLVDRTAPCGKTPPGDYSLNRYWEIDIFKSLSRHFRRR
jgi:hypothetical protein